MSVSIKAAGLLLVVIICGCAGTETGNPVTTHLGSDRGVATMISGIGYSLCERISSCHQSPPTDQDCFDDLFLQENIDTEIGLQEGDYPTLIDVLVAEYKSILKPDELSVEQCKADISALTCDDELVQNAYLPEEENPYEGVAAAIPESCQGIYVTASGE